MKFVFVTFVCVTLALQSLFAANCTAAMATISEPETSVRYDAPLNTAEQLTTSQYVSSQCNCGDLSLTTALHALDVLVVSTPFVVTPSPTLHFTSPLLIDPPPRAAIA